MAIFIFFLEYWRLFLVDWRYGCQYSRNIFFLSVLKLGLRHYLYYFQKIYEVILVRLKLRLTRCRQKILLYGLEIRFTALSVLFLEHWRFFCRLDVRLPRYGQNLLFAYFKIGFTALSVLFLEHWWFFCVDWRNGYQDGGKMFYSSVLKLGIQHFSFYFQNIGHNFALIRDTVSQIRPQPYIFPLL